ncbi:Uncharacterised protein [Mycobacteroides abscessus subsp. abscessus]|nr:Uncharacterised protein [Mycobacteroides abscessus]SKV36734.1 Uncharacterised protein [Mycobacteroides abscessus subsp. abscessus]
MYFIIEAARPLAEPLIRPSLTILVLTNVGHSTVTLMPDPLSSADSVSESASTPALLTL